jgi:hypothetical protein
MNEQCDKRWAAPAVLAVSAYALMRLVLLMTGAAPCL